MMSPWNPSGWRHRRKRRFFYQRPDTLPPGCEEDTDQLVVPTEFCHEVMMMAHGVKLAAHLGVDKSTRKAYHDFFWPGLWKDMKGFFQTREACQHGSKANRPRAPLQPLPAMQARTQGGFSRTPLLKSSIHMNLYCVYVGHTHLIEIALIFAKKNPPVSKAGYGPAMEEPFQRVAVDIVGRLCLTS